MIERAVELALTSEHTKWRLGAIVTSGPRLLSSSTNRLRNPPHINHLHSTTHAEMAALRGCVLPCKGRNNIRGARQSSR